MLGTPLSVSGAQCASSTTCMGPAVPGAKKLIPTYFDSLTFESKMNGAIDIESGCSLGIIHSES